MGVVCGRRRSNLDFTFQRTTSLDLVCPGPSLSTPVSESYGGAPVVGRRPSGRRSTQDDRSRMGEYGWSEVRVGKSCSGPTGSPYGWTLGGKIGHLCPNSTTGRPSPKSPCQGRPSRTFPFPHLGRSTHLFLGPIGPPIPFPPTPPDRRVVPLSLRPSPSSPCLSRLPVRLNLNSGSRRITDTLEPLH